MLKLRLHISSNIKLCFHRCVIITKYVGWKSLINSMNSIFNNKRSTTVVSFLLCIRRYTTYLNCFYYPCTFEIKHITSSFDFDRLKKILGSVRFHVFSICLFWSVIFKVHALTLYRMLCPFVFKLMCCVWLQIITPTSFYKLFLLRNPRLLWTQRHFPLLSILLL